VKVPADVELVDRLAFGGRGGSTTVRLAKVYAASRLLSGIG
jgi:hypothetical protein